MASAPAPKRPCGNTTHEQTLYYYYNGFAAFAVRRTYFVIYNKICMNTSRRRSPTFLPNNSVKLGLQSLVMWGTAGRLP